MAGGVEFELNFAAEIQRASALIEATPAQLSKAAQRAMKKTTAWMQSRIAREVSQAVAIPQSVLKQRITVSRKGTGADQAHIVWFGIAPVSAEKLKARQTKTGVSAGKHRFKGAFYKKVYGSGERVWIRKARAQSLGMSLPGMDKVKGTDDGRFPLVKVSVEVAAASEIFKRYSNRAQARFQKLLEQELNYVVTHGG